MVNDPIADMLTRIRNAVMVGHESVLIPHSRVKVAVAKILKEQSFIADFESVKAKPSQMLRVQLRYVDKQPAVLGLERVSACVWWPRCRHHVDVTGNHDRTAGVAEEARWRGSVLRLVGRMWGNS
jgi:ribosomal protein S8